MNNTATFKVGPNHKLTKGQQRLTKQIQQFTIQHLHSSKHAIFTIYGDAGTGKSVVLSQLFYNLQQEAHTTNNPLYKTTNYFLVNHPELLKVYRQIASQEPHMYKKNFQRPTSFINHMHKKHAHNDITVVDEAHLLLSEGDHYNNFYQHNQLAEILKISQVVIIVFDRHQVLRTKSFWDNRLLKKVEAPYIQKDYHLTHQFRMTASNELLKWINQFTDGKLTSIPQYFGKHFDFKVFNNAEQMRQAIVKRNQEVGLSRIVSTSGYPSTLDGGKHYIHETGGFEMPWDQYNYTQVPYAELPQTIDEVGSMFTCQGFDLNYVGVILGPPVYLKPHTNQIKIDFSHYTDVESLRKRKDIPDQKRFNQVKTRLVLNDINVLMKRGIKGLYVYAHDGLLRKQLIQNYRKAKFRGK